MINAAVVVGDDGVAGRARVVEVQIVVVGEAWRERGIVDDTGTVDVEGDSRAARYEVKGGRPGGELDRVDLGVVGDGHRGRSPVVGERRRILGHLARPPVVVFRPLGPRAGPGAILRIYSARRQHGE